MTIVKVKKNGKHILLDKDTATTLTFEPCDDVLKDGQYECKWKCAFAGRVYYIVDDIYEVSVNFRPLLIRRDVGMPANKYFRIGYFYRLGHALTTAMTHFLRKPPILVGMTYKS